MEHKEIQMSGSNLFTRSSQALWGQLYSKNLPSSISDATQRELQQLPDHFLSSDIISKSSEKQLDCLTLLLPAPACDPACETFVQQFLLPII